MDTKKLRQKILDLAIRGKLVPQDPNDEPASVLLERIRAEKERLIKEGKIKRSKKTAENTSENEEPFEVPSDWTICKLEDIAYIGTGATPDTRNKDYYNGNIPWVSSSCTKNDYIDSPTSYISQKAINETNCQIYPKGTLIMAMYGEGKTRGQVGELRIDAATNQACAAIMPYLISSTLYIKLYLKRSYLNIRQQAEGGLQPNLNLSKIAQYDIPLPPLAEQKRIVSEIERWFAVIDELESNEDDLLKAIDKAKSKILDLAIHGKLVPQDPNDEPAIELLKRINPKFEPCKNELDDIQLPNSWCWTTLESVSTDSADGPFGSNLKKEHYTSNKEVRIIQLSNIGEEGWREENTKYTTFEHLKDISRSEVLPNDIVIAKMMPAGRAILCPNNEHKYVLSSDAVKFHIVDNIDCRYILYAINSELFRNQVYRNVQGVTRVRTSLQKLRKYCVPIPPYQEQLRIVTKIEEAFKVMDALS